MADPIPAWPGALVTLDVGEVFVRTVPAQLDSAQLDSAQVDSAQLDSAELESARPGQAQPESVPAVAVPSDALPPPAESALFVHGLGGSSRNWTDLMDLLSRPQSRPRLASEAIDLPGFGYSPVPADADYSIDGRAAAVIALIDKHGRWPVHLIGNSLGGAVCIRVAARRPDLVRTLTLISPAMPDLRPRLLPLRIAALALPGLGPWVLGKLELTSAETRTTRMVGEVYADPARLHPARFREEVEEVIRRDGLGYQREALIGSARALVAEYTRFGPKTLWRDAARITAPTLVIHGSHDRLVNPVMAARAARELRNAHVVVLPRIGHVAMLERPDLVARLIREFLGAATEPTGIDRVPAPEQLTQEPSAVEPGAIEPSAMEQNQVAN